MSKIKEFQKEKSRAFPEESELANRIQKVIDDYKELSAVSVAGVLDMVKLDVLMVNRGK